ncbi:MAG TPA: hypothetical protein VLU96_10255 [Gaiellaceae bacterium]|nr:hypothetical protein [Gaiellaceae bacterium]
MQVTLLTAELEELDELGADPTRACRRAIAGLSRLQRLARFLNAG